MATLKELKANRLAKLDQIKKAKIDPYPAKGQRSHTNQEAIANFDKLSTDKESVFLVGRIKAIRIHGGSIFVHIDDFSASFQLYFKKDTLGSAKFNFFQENFDLGDFIEAKGFLFLTKKGEKTLEVADYKILTKAISPLPEEWYGFKDTEERFRKRYLDLLMNEKVKTRFIQRFKIIKAIRQFLDERDFIEVETPVLQNLHGGALARPFQTHLNALDLDLSLRIAPELYLKRLLVGGFEKVYEIGRCFRNEGLDSAHNPDFTMLEYYWAYADYQDLIKLTEAMFKYILEKIDRADLTINYQNQEINFKAPFAQKEFLDLGKTDEEVKEQIKNIIQPTFIINHPLEISPLAKQLTDQPSKVARFQLVVGGQEISNAYSELNDPQEQARRFEQQQQSKEAGNQETQPYDQDFIEALEYGMPPAAGFGLGLDRLAALLTDAPSLREVILFPTMKPKQ